MNIYNFKKCGVVILWIDGKIMLCERKKGKFKGKFGVAGGKIEEGEDIASGVSREFYEEAGAFLWTNYLRFIDCYIIPEAEQKVFIFESAFNETFFRKILNTEPEKHGKWTLYTKTEALKLDLMPYIRTYLENIEQLPKNQE
jgi:8-oxo-dGTP pyrophosphatase MutT (NUDIX family)